MKIIFFYFHKKPNILMIEIFKETFCSNLVSVEALKQNEWKQHDAHASSVHSCNLV